MWILAATLSHSTRGPWPPEGAFGVQAPPKPKFQEARHVGSFTATAPAPKTMREGHERGQGTRFMSVPTGLSMAWHKAQ